MLQSDEYLSVDEEDEEDDDGLLEYKELEAEPADLTQNGLYGSFVLSYHPMLWSKTLLGGIRLRTIIWKCFIARSAQPFFTAALSYRRQTLTPPPRNTNSSSESS